MNRFKELREQKHLTLNELSIAVKAQQQIYISPDSLAKYEQGERQPKIDKLEALATFYGTSVAYLRGLDMAKLSDRKEQLKQAFINEVRKSSTFYLKVTYNKDKITEISVIYKFGYGQRAFTVRCLANNEEMFETRQIYLGKHIVLIPKETIELAHLLLDAGYLIDNLDKLDKDDDENRED